MIRASGKHAARAAAKLIERADRKPLLRRSELRANPVDPVTGEKRWSTFKTPTKATLVSTTRLKRSRLVSLVKARTSAQGGDLPYLAWVRTQPCCRCGARPPNHAHHEILNGRGKSQKAPDARTLPLCARCHDDFHAVTGRFAGFTREQRRDFQDIEITRLRAVHAGIVDHGVAQEPLHESI